MNRHVISNVCMYESALAFKPTSLHHFVFCDQQLFWPLVVLTTSFVFLGHHSYLQVTWNIHTYIHTNKQYRLAFKLHIHVSLIYIYIYHSYTYTYITHIHIHVSLILSSYVHTYSIYIVCICIHTHTNIHTYILPYVGMCGKILHTYSI